MSNCENMHASMNAKWTILKSKFHCDRLVDRPSTSTRRIV